MTRVILTNKKTGQELPEAELAQEPDDYLHIRFDGAAGPNTFRIKEWNYREARTFRNGDVLRRKDRSNRFIRYMYVVESFETEGQWVEVDSVGATYVRANPAALNDPEWELV